MKRGRPCWRPLLHAAGLALLALAAAACSPTKPTPPPALPTITCPADVAAVSNDGASVAATYLVPTPVGGVEPVFVACSPAPGSVFAPGSTAVRCTATDALARTATCGFAVKVSVPPRLRLTKFMAFGDSLTEGKPSRIWALDDFAGSYPGVLYSLLVLRYTGQTITMSKQGYGGESTAAGVIRLNGLLVSQRPEVLLLMEGSNDLSGGDATAIPPAVRNVEQMVVNARAAGAEVFLATIPPQVPGSTSGRGYAIVPTYNSQLRALADKYNATLVDVFTPLNADLPAYFGADGLHCKTAGYQKMADTFLASIQAKLESPGITPASVAGSTFGIQVTR
jgi:lysophospholipase L1-like esterase